MTGNDSVRNPIDLFVLSRSESRGIEASPAANRDTLIKRLYYDLIGYDLIGLPPPPEDVAPFLAAHEV